MLQELTESISTLRINDPVVRVGCSLGYTSNGCKMTVH